MAIVDEVEAGAETQLRDALEAMLKTAHERAKPLAAQRDAQEETEQGSQAASEMRERFRSFGDRS